MRRVLAWPLALAWALAAGGCGGGSTADVSGVVTLGGQPLEGAAVTFTPESTKDAEVGGSYGRTDAQGKFTLKTVAGDRAGAAVGKHRVSISLYKGDPNNPDGAGKEAVPARYNAKTALTFDVPAGGTDKANFELTR